MLNKKYIFFYSCLINLDLLNFILKYNIYLSPLLMMIFSKQSRIYFKYIKMYFIVKKVFFFKLFRNLCCIFVFFFVYFYDIFFTIDSDGNFKWLYSDIYTDFLKGFNIYFSFFIKIFNIKLNIFDNILFNIKYFYYNYYLHFCFYIKWLLKKKIFYSYYNFFLIIFFLSFKYTYFSSFLYCIYEHLSILNICFFTFYYNIINIIFINIISIFIDYYRISELLYYKDDYVLFFINSIYNSRIFTPILVTDIFKINSIMQHFIFYDTAIYKNCINIFCILGEYMYFFKSTNITFFLLLYFFIILFYRKCIFIGYQLFIMRKMLYNVLYARIFNKKYFKYYLNIALIESESIECSVAINYKLFKHFEELPIILFIGLMVPCMFSFKHPVPVYNEVTLPEIEYFEDELVDLNSLEYEYLYNDGFVNEKSGQYLLSLGQKYFFRSTLDYYDDFEINDYDNYVNLLLKEELFNYNIIPLNNYNFFFNSFEEILVLKKFFEQNNIFYNYLKLTNNPFLAKTKLFVSEYKSLDLLIKQESIYNSILKLKFDDIKTMDQIRYWDSANIDRIHDCFYGAILNYSEFFDYSYIVHNSELLHTISQYDLFIFDNNLIIKFLKKKFNTIFLKKGILNTDLDYINLENHFIYGRSLQFSFKFSSNALLDSYYEFLYLYGVINNKDILLPYINSFYKSFYYFPPKLIFDKVPYFMDIFFCTTENNGKDGSHLERFLYYMDMECIGIDILDMLYKDYKYTSSKLKYDLINVYNYGKDENVVLEKIKYIKTIKVGNLEIHICDPHYVMLKSTKSYYKYLLEQYNVIGSLFEGPIRIFNFYEIQMKNFCNESFVAKHLFFYKNNMSFMSYKYMEYYEMFKYSKFLSDGYKPLWFLQNNNQKYYNLKYNNIFHNYNIEQKKNENLDFFGKSKLDVPHIDQVNFQDSATPTMEGLIDFHHELVFFMILISIFVSIFLLFIVFNFKNNIIRDFINYKKPLLVSHNTILEIIWTIIPGIILFAIAVPSFALLYAMDEVINPGITLKVIGHQWFWSYEYGDPLPQFKKVSEQVHVKNLLNIPKVVKRLRERREAVLYTERMEIVQEAFRNLILKELMKRNGNIEKYKKILIKIDYMQTLLYTLDGVKVIKERQKKTKIFANNENYLYKSSQDNPSVILADKAARYKRVDVIEELNKFLKNEEIQEALDYYESNLRSEDSIKKFKNAFLKGKRRSIREILRESSLYKEIRDKKIYGFNYYNKKIKLYFLNEVEALYNDLYFGQINPTPCNDELVSFSNFLVQDIDLLHRDGLSLNQRRLLDINSDISSISMIYGDDFIIAQKRQKTDKLGLNIMQSDIFRNVWLNDFFEKASRIEKYRKMVNMPMVSWETCLGDPFYSFSGLGFISDRLSKQSMYLTENFDYYINIKSDNFKLLLELREKVLSTYLITYYPNFFYFIYRKNEKNYICPDVYDLDIIKTVHEFLMYDKGEGLYNFTGLLGPDSSDVVDIYEHWDEYVVDDFESLRTGVDQYICKLYFYLSYNEIYKKRIVNNFRTLKNDQYKNNYYFIKMQHVVSSLNTGEIKSYNIFFNKNYFPIDEGAEVILRFISDYSDPYRKLNYIKINQSIEIDYATVLTQKKDEETLNNSIDYLEQFKFNYPLKNFNDIKLKKNLTKDQTKYMLFLGFRDLLNVVYISSYFSRLSDNKVNEICENAVDIFLEKYENELRISYNKDAVGNIFEQKKLNDLFFIVVESIKDAANKKQNYVNYELDYSSELNFSSSILHLKDQINKKYLKMFNKNDILNFIENQIKINNYLVTEEVINKLAIIYKEHLAKEIYYLNSLLNKHGLESITIQEYSIKKPFTLYSDDILNDFYDNNIIISQSIGKGFIDISDISTDKYFLNEIQNRFKLNNILIKESSFTIGSVLKSYVYSFFESFKVHNFSNSDNKDVLNVLSKLKLNPVRDFKLNYNKHSILLDDKVELLNTINFWITKKISDDDFFYKFEDFQNKYRLDSPEVVDDFHKIIYKICNFTKKELVYDLENQYLIYKFYDRNSYFFKRFSTFTFAKEVFSNIDGICIEKESEKEFNYIYNFKFSNFYNNKPMYLTNFLENKKVSGKIRLGRYAVLKMYTHYSKKYKDVSLDFTSFYRIISENIAQISLTKMYYKGENLKENYSYFSPEDYYPIYSQLLKNYFNVMKSTSYEKLKYPINRKVFLNQMELIFQLYSTNPTIFNINLESDKSILMFTTYLKYFFRWAKINDEFYLPLLMSKYFKNNKLFLADKSKYDFIKGFIKSYENIKPLGEYVYNPTENELKTIFSLNSFESLNQMMVFYVNYTVMPTVCKLFGSKNSLFHVGNYLNNKSKVILEDIDIYRNLSNYRLNNLTENIRYSRNYLNKSFVTSFYDFTLEDLKLNKKNNIKTVSNIHKLKFVIPEKVTLNEYENFLNIGVCQVIGDYKKSLKINKVHSSFSNGISKYNYMFADVYNNLFQKYFEVRDLNNHIFLLKDLFNYKKRLRYLIEERDVSNSISYIKSEMLARESKLIDSYGNNYLHKYEDTVFQKDIKQKKILYSKSCVDDTLDDNEYLKEDSEYGWLIDNAKEFSIYYKKSCNDIYLNLRSLYNPDRSIELIDEHTPVINDSLREVYMFDSRLYINMELSSEMKDIMLERFGKAIYKLQLNNVSFDKDTLWLWRTYNRMMSFVESMEDITLPHDSLSISYQGYGAYHRYLIFCSTVPPISSHTSVLKTVENLNVQKYIRLKKYNQIFFNKLKDFNENYFKSLSDKYVTCNLFYQKNFNMILGQNELMLNPSKYFLKNIFNYVNYSQDIFLETILKNSKKSTYNNIFYKQCLNFLENNGKEYYFSKCNFLANINYNKYLNYYLYNISEDADDRIMRLCRIVYTNLGDQSDDTKLAFEFNELRESLFKDIETYRKLYSLKNSSYTVNGLNYLSFIKSNKNNILYNVVVSGYKDIEKNAIIKGKNYFLQESYSNTDWYTKKLNSFAYLTQEIDGGFEFINFSKKINEKLPAYIQSNDKLLSDDHFVYQMALNDIVHEYAFCIEEVRDIFKNGRMHTLLKNDFKRTESRYNFLSSTKIDNASQGLEALAGSLDRNDFSSDYKVNNVLKNVFTKKYTNIENKEFIDYEEIVDSSFYENLGLSKDDTCILFNGKSDFNCFKQLIELNTYDEVTSHEQIQKFLDLDTVSKAFCNNSRDNIKKFIFFSIPSFNFESTFIYNFIGKCVIKLKWKSIFFQRRILFSYPYLEKQKVTDFSTNLLNFELTEYPKAESFNKIVAAEDQLHNTFQRLKTNSSAISLVSIFGNYNAKVHGMELTDFMEYNIDKRVNLFIKSFSKGDIKGFLIFKRPAKLKKVYCIFNFPRFEKKFLFNFKGIQKYFLYNSFKSSNKIWTFSHRPSNTFFVKLMKYINNYKFRIYGQDIFFVGDNLQLPKIPKLVSLPELYFNLGYRRLMLDFLYNSIFLNNTYYRLSKKSQCLNEDTSMRYRSNGSFLIDRNVYNDNKLTNFGNYFRRGVSPKFRVTKLLNGLDDISLCLKGLRRISKKVQINVLYHNACVKHYGASLTFQKYSITEKEMATLYSTVHYDIFRAQLEVLHRLRILAYDAAKTIGTGEKDLFERKAVMGFKQDPNLIKLLQKKRNLRLKMAKAYYIRAKNTAIKHGGIILLFESYRKNNLESYSIQTSKKYKEFLYLSNSASNCVEINAILTQTEWNLIDFETKNWSFYQYAKHFSKIKVNNPILNLIKKKSNTPYMMFPDIPIKYFDQYFRAITVEYDSTFNEKEEELEDFPFVEGLFYSTDTDCFRDYKKEFKSEFLQNNVNLYADRFYNVRSGNILIKFDSYMLPEDELIEGMFRNLEVDQRVFLPEKVHVRVLVTADDVLHSWAIPSLGVKMDACPGRLNQTEIFSKRTGVFYGQCSEICGINHGFMPIVIEIVNPNVYANWIYKKFLGK